MGTKYDIEHYGRKLDAALSTSTGNDWRRFYRAVAKLASEVDALELRLRKLESSIR